MDRFLALFAILMFDVLFARSQDYSESPTSDACVAECQTISADDPTPRVTFTDISVPATYTLSGSSASDYLLLSPTPDPIASSTQEFILSVGTTSPSFNPTTSTSYSATASNFRTVPSSDASMARPVYSPPSSVHLSTSTVYVSKEASTSSSTVLSTSVNMSVILSLSAPHSSAIYPPSTVHLSGVTNPTPPSTVNTGITAADSNTIYTELIFATSVVIIVVSLIVAITVVLVVYRIKPKAQAPIGIRTCRGASLRKAEEQVYVNSSAVKTGNSKTREELKLECIEMKIKDESTTDPNEEYELICYNEEETVTKL